MQKGRRQVISHEAIRSRKNLFVFSYWPSVISWKKTMKAVVKAKAELGLWVEDVPIPKVGGDDVLIRVLKASICGTDVHIYNWDDWAQKTIPVPMTIGHEFAGVVDAVGDHVKGFARGDLVVGEGHITCGHCRNCLAGRRHLCPEHPRGRGESSRRLGRFVAIPQDNCWHADPSISAGRAFLLRPVRQRGAHCALI